MTQIEIAEWKAAKVNEPFFRLLHEASEQWAKESCIGSTAEETCHLVSYRHGYRMCLEFILGLEEDSGKEDATDGPGTKKRSNG